MCSAGIRFSDVFMGCRKATPGCNGLNLFNHVKYFFAIVLFRQKLPLQFAAVNFKTFKTIRKAEKTK